MAKYWIGKPKQIEGALVPMFGCHVFNGDAAMAMCQAFGRNEEEAHAGAQCIIAAMVAVETRPAVAAKARHYIVRSKPYVAEHKQVQNTPRDTPGPVTKLPTPEQDDRYSYYWDQCDKANKPALAFDAWVKAGEPDHG